jgi:DNA-binding NarL/FixJ family response regulator
MAGLGRRSLRPMCFTSLVLSGQRTQLMHAVTETKPDVAIVDVRMPPTHTDEGARAAKEIRELHPDVGVLVLSQVVEAGHALDLFSERPEGFGYLLKDRVLEIDEFLESVRRVARGGTAVDPEVVAQLMGRRRAIDPLEDLSPREREVLGLMAEGSPTGGSARASSSAQRPLRHTCTASSGSFGCRRQPTITDAFWQCLRFCGRAEGQARAGAPARCRRSGRGGDLRRRAAVELLRVLVPLGRLSLAIVVSCEALQPRFRAPPRHRTS